MHIKEYNIRDIFELNADSLGSLI